MPIVLQNKVALITGGAGNLGKHVVRVFLEAGAKVIAADAHLETLKDLCEEFSPTNHMHCIETNVMDEAKVSQMVQETAGRDGRIDILLCIAGGFSMGPTVADTTLKDWDFMMDLNLKSFFLAAKHVFPIMKRQKSGRILSIAARPALEGGAGMAAYAASKAAVVNLNQSLAAEGKEFHITSNTFLPGIIDTPANREAMPDADFSAWVSPLRLAQTLAFFSGEAASDINGAAIPVYGRS